jgi:hypothetical protein
MALQAADGDSEVFKSAVLIVGATFFLPPLFSFQGEILN